MLKSMTAYGRSDCTSDMGHITVELQSVNRRFLEVSVSLPRELTQHEMAIRTALRKSLKRGAVSVRVDLSCYKSGDLVANQELLEQLQGGWKEIASDFGCESLTSDQWIRVLSQRHDLFQFQETAKDEWDPLLFQALEEALENLQQMREKEGKRLTSDLLERIAILGDLIDKIAALGDGTVDRYRTKLEERLKSFSDELGENRDRILREVALYVDRIDISEEVTRVRSHLSQMVATIQADSNEGVGKKLDFLSQELLREFNTLASKSPASEAVQVAVDAKSELERVREQVQNVE